MKSRFRLIRFRKGNCKFRFLAVFILIVVLGHYKTHGQIQEIKYQLTVRVLDGERNQPLENADVFIQPCACGGITDFNGVFTMELPQDNYTISVSFIGYGTETRSVVLDQDTLLEMEVRQKEEQLSEVVLEARRANQEIRSPQMGVIQIQPKELKKIPAPAGEVDVLRAATLLPGVNNAGDISNGLSIRGGSLDQNLLLYEHAPVFNPTHLFGLFSVFTPDMVSSVDLYRANIPSRYGGRTSSVMDIGVKSPFVDKFKLSGGLGLVSSRLTVETPIVKDKLMVIAGGRASFTDFLLPLFSDRLENTEAKFYDGTLKLMYLPSKKDQLSFTAFYSKDFYQLDLISRIENIVAENNQYDFETLNGTLEWLHSFNSNTSLRTQVVSGNYTAKNIFPEVGNPNEIEYDSKIKLLGITSEVANREVGPFGYYLGTQLNRYQIHPGKLDPGNGDSVLPIELERETSYELSGYGNLNWKPLDGMEVSAGLRYTQFLLYGPFTLNTYDATNQNVLQSEFIADGEQVDSFNGLEPRLGLSLGLGKDMSVKLSYARLNQYLQNIYNSTTPLPTSRWKTVDPNIEPQRSDAFGAGIYGNLNQSGIEIGLEGYYRKSENNLTYRPGADFFLERFVERSVVQGPGKAYGVELSIRKPRGAINGWLNYTWSRSFLRTESQNLAEQTNNNQWFPSDFDRPHVLNATVNFEGGPYNKFSLNFTGQTGRPITLANGVIELNDGITAPLFLERNNARLPVYHRLDFSWHVNFSKSKKNKRWVNDWTFTIYNLYARRNPLNIYYTPINNEQEAILFKGNPLGSFELSVINSPLVSLTYNFTFQ